jgi:hypothetical protein
MIYVGSNMQFEVVLGISKVFGDLRAGLARAFASSFSWKSRLIPCHSYFGTVICCS